MNSFFMLTIVALVVATVYGKAAPLREEDFNVEAVIGNVHALRGLVECFLDRVPCDPMGHAFKIDLPEGIHNICGHCNKLQKSIFKTFLVGLKNKLPEDYEALKQKYDPEAKHFDTLEAALVNF